MRWTDLPNVLVSSAWAFLLILGLEGIASIQEQHAPGYPALGQCLLYVSLPGAFVCCGMLAAVLARRTGWFYDLYPFAVGLVGVCLFPVLLLWSGGM
jgi:hypothetical protein